MLGVLVQANFSGTLSVLGVRIQRDKALAGVSERADQGPGNSCMIVVAIDCALDARQLTRVARRAIFGLGRTGADFAGSSGDYAIAFATGDGAAAPESSLEPIFAAVQEAVDEAVLNSLFMAVTTVGHLGHTRYAVPSDFVVRACRDAGVLGS